MFLRLLFLMLLLFFNKHLLAYEFPVQIIEDFDSSRIVASIEESDIDESLRWLPTESPPPMLIADVVHLIEKYIDSDSRLAHPTFKQIALKKIPHYENYWHYIVEIQEEINNNPEIYYYLVLMNGKVIPALREPESVK